MSPDFGKLSLGTAKSVAVKWSSQLIFIKANGPKSQNKSKGGNLQINTKPQDEENKIINDL